MLWSAQSIIKATQGVPLGGEDWQAAGISIDSQSTLPGDLFIALKGPNHDGHSHIEQAAEAGASAALVDHPVDASIPAVQVNHTLCGLRQMAIASRLRSTAQRIAVTGSVGKTGTRHIISTLLAAHGHCHASEGNLNNHIGAPLSLARMPARSQFGVFELGMNHAGEIADLSPLVKPDYAIITRIAKSHIGHFNSLEDIASAKGEIFQGLADGGIAVLNADDPFTPFLSSLAREHGASRIITIGENKSADHRILGISRQAHGIEVAALINGIRVSFTLGMSGTHNAWSALFALAIAESEGLDRDRSLEALAGIDDIPGRGKHHNVTYPDGRRFTLIDDSYNASPASMEAALRDLSGNPRHGRRVAILADMLELGEESDALHRSLGKTLLAAPPAVVIAFGEGMHSLAGSMPDAPFQMHLSDDADAATGLAFRHVRDGDVVLVKGSNGMRTPALMRNLLKGPPPHNGESHVA